jgi:ABC-2 type transport system ATP-binding protein
VAWSALLGPHVNGWSSAPVPDLLWPVVALVRSPQLDSLLPRLRSLGAVIAASSAAGVAAVGSLAPERIGEVAAELGVTLHELRPRLRSLEEGYTRMTADSIEYHSGQTRSAA